MPKSSDSSSRREFLKSSAAATLAVASSGVLAHAAEPPKPAAEMHRPLPRIVVHSDGHMLCTEDGSPFFWLGDTAWLLNQVLTREECSYYLQTRARQGFNVVQIMLLAEFGGITKPTTLGLLPFADGDLKRPNETFFDRFAEIVNEAATLGMYAAIIPVWGDKLTAPWGTGPKMFRNDNLEDARAFTRYVGNKFKACTNVLWGLGGDRPARLKGMNNEFLQNLGKEAGFPPDQDWTPIWRAFADGLREGLGTTPTIFYHPQGGKESSSFFLHQEPWLSINGMQSGHGGGHDLPVWEMVARDYALMPAKPTIDLEPNYEDHPYDPWPTWDAATGFFRDHDVRKQIYRSLRWRMRRHIRAQLGMAVCGKRARGEVLSGPRLGRRLVSSRRTTDAVSTAAHRVAPVLPASARSIAHRRRRRQRRTSPPGRARPRRQLCLRLLPDDGPGRHHRPWQIEGKEVRAWWYDPRAGFAMPLPEPEAGKAAEFRTPPYGPDWVLVVDDVEAGYLTPGLTKVTL